MPPVRTQVPCPNCRMPVAATIEQVFDVAQDPGARQRFLSGRFNLISCPNCRFQGQVTSPLLYHDPDRELLITFVPMELAMPQVEQEKAIGRMVNEVINNLPQERRRGYLLNPTSAFTLQGMTERVLEAEGVTKEMLEAQRSKMQLIQTMLTSPAAQLPELIQQHDAEIDTTFFQLLSAAAEASGAGANAAAAERVLGLQQALLQHSTLGKQARQRQETVEAVARELQALGDKLTPDRLLELVVQSKDDDRLAALVSFTRAGMDYAFFEALTRRIDKASGEDKDRLAHIREKLLELTKQMDQAAQAEVAEASELLRTLMEAPNLGEAIAENMPRIDETFLAVLSMNIEAAERAKRPDVVERMTRINEAIMRVMQEAAPPEVRFINELLQMDSDSEAIAALRARGGEINQQLIDTMNYISQSLRQSGQEQLAERLDALRGEAVGELMKANWLK
jgi:hypothetical protein